MWTHRAFAFLLMSWAAYWCYQLFQLGWEFDQDDAFITFRYARNWVEGHGIVWNIGERPVEGYSNFTTLLIAAGALARNNDPLYAVKVVNTVAVGCTALFTYVLSRRFVGPVAATIPTLILTSYGGEVMWAVSGLETALYQSLTVLAVLCTVLGLGYRAVGPDHPLGRQGSMRPWWIGLAALVAALAGMTRPEGPLVAIGIGAALSLRWIRMTLSRAPIEERKIAFRACVLFASIFGVLYGSYFGWRLFYFGRLLPNTVYCKAFWDGDPWSLLVEFWRDWSIVIYASLVFPLRRIDERHAMLWGIPLLYAVALYGADPVVAYASRHFLAAVALLAVAAAAAGAWIARASLGRRGWAAEWLLAIAVALVAWVGREREEGNISRWRESYVSRGTTRADLGDYIAETLPPNATFVMGDVGVVGYATRQRLIDAYCLNSRVMTTPPVSLSGTRYVNWIMDQDPEMIVVQSRHILTFIPPVEFCYGFYRALVEHPEFKSQYVRVHQTGAGHFNYMVYRRLGVGMVGAGKTLPAAPASPDASATEDASSTSDDDFDEIKGVHEPKEIPDE